MTKKKGGRPSKFNPRFTKEVEKLCKLGATDVQLADFFEVTRQTVDNWKKEHPEFFASIKKGKLVADNEVARSLYHRAIGYNHPEIKAQLDRDGNWQTLDMVKHYAPDTMACMYWLNNRAEEWTQKQEIVNKDETADAYDDLLKQISKLPINKLEKMLK